MKILIGFTYAPLAPDTYGCTPIHYAAANGNLDTTKFLVGLIDTPNALDNHGCCCSNLYRKNGNTPIEFAKFYKNVEVQKFLENHCASLWALYRINAKLFKSVLIFV